MRDSKFKLVAIAVVGLWMIPACGSVHGNTECASQVDCNLASSGSCDEYTMTGSSWCSYPDTACSTGRRWSDFNTGDGLSGACQDDYKDASVADGATGTDSAVADDATAPEIDAGIADAFIADAAPVPTTWDVAYVNSSIGTTGFSLTQYVRIANTGTTPLDMGTLQVVSTTHTGPGTVAVNLTIETVGINAILQPGQAGGRLNSGTVGEQLIVGSGLMTETLVDDTDYFRLTVSAINNDPVFTITSVIRIGGREATMVFTASPLSFTNFITAERVSAL